MIKIYKCKCNKEMKLEYSKSTRVVFGTVFGVEWRYIWTCEGCGQDYYERCKDAIEIK